MSFTELLEPILRGGIRSVNFFNGRLLSAEDLKQEQEANREGRARLGQAVGEGIAYGLEVSAAAASTAQTPVVTVGQGLCVNRLGRALKLTAPTDLALVQQAPEEQAPAGTTFKDCRLAQGGVHVTGAGVYLLTIAPAEGPEGRAPFSGLGNTVVTCNTRYTVEGVQFRLVRLLNSTQLGNVKTLRSRMAYDCLGLSQLIDFERRPLGPSLTQYGLLDSKRPAQLADSEVPLALVYWAEGGLGFVDNWSVRRSLIQRAASERFEPLAGDRRRAEAQAAMFHFQDHVAAIQGDTAVTDTLNLKTDEHFAFLPAAGLLPVTGARGFDWKKFLGPHAPPRETSVDEGLLRSLVERALLLDPVKVNSFASGSAYSAAPPAPYSVYRVPEGADFVLFARSAHARVRVFLSPANTPVTAGQVYAEDTRRTGLRTQAHIAERNGIYPVVDLEAGRYQVIVYAPGVFTGSETVEVVGGRTKDVAFVITTPGGLLLTVENAQTGAGIGDKVTGVTLTPAGGGTPLQATKTAGNKWLATNVPPGRYTVRVTAEGFVTEEITNVEITVAETLELTARLDPLPVTTGLITMQIMNARTQARIEGVVTEVTATNTASGAVVAATKRDNTYSFVDIPAGEYNIVVKATNYTQAAVNQVAIAAAQVKTVPASLEPFPGRILLNLIDKNTGVAIDNLAGVTVQAVAGATTVNGTKVSGKWRIENLVPGTYEVRVSAPNYANATLTNVTVGVAGEVARNVEMEPARGSIGIFLNYPNSGRFGNFEVIVTPLSPAGQPPMAPVNFGPNNDAVINAVPAGTARVRIREKQSTPTAGYPETIFNVTVLPNQRSNREVGLPTTGVSYTIGESRPYYKPRTHYHWSVDPHIVDSPPASPWGTMPASTPLRPDVRTWLEAWRDWLVLTRPDLGLDPAAAPREATTGDNSPASDYEEQTGRAIFTKPGGAKVGMRLDISIIFEREVRREPQD